MTATGVRGLAARPRVPGVVVRATAVSFLSASADNALLLLILWVAGPQGWTGAQTALVVLTLRLPTLLTGVLLGRAVDRWGARPVVCLDLGTRTALLALLALAGRGGQLPLGPVLVLGCLAGATAPATYAGVRWLLPRVAPAEALGRCNAVLALGDQLPLVAGAAVAGPALTVLGPATGMLVPAGLLAAATVLALRLPGAGSAVRPAVPPAAGRAARPGTRRPRVVAVIALSTAYYLAYGPFETASPAFVRDRLDGAEGLYSWLWLLFGLGAVATLPVAPWLARRRPGVVNAVGALIWGLLMLPVAVVRDPFPAAGLFLAGGAVWGPYTTVETSALQRWVDPARHGALFGLQRGLLATAAPVGAAVGALALDAFPAHRVLAGSAGTCAVAGLLALASRDLRRAR